LSFGGRAQLPFHLGHMRMLEPGIPQRREVFQDLFDLFSFPGDDQLAIAEINRVRFFEPFLKHQRVREIGPNPELGRIDRERRRRAPQRDLRSARRSTRARRGI
jgi:hypothetical protein